MNKHFYRVIFNKALGLWQCVSELAKTAGKSKSLKAVVVATTLAMSGASFAIELTDGKVHHITDSVHAAGNIIVKNANTKLTSDSQIILGSTTNPNIVNTIVEISNQATVESPDETIISYNHNTNATVDNANLHSKKSLLIGFDPTKTAHLIGKNGAKITAGGIVSIGYNNDTTASRCFNDRSI